MSTAKTRRDKIILTAEIAILSAIIVVMAFTPLGFLRVGPLELTLIMVPVIVGAVTMSPAVGAILGGVFGVMSFIQCFTGSALGAILVSVSIVRTFIVCIPTRILAGYLCGLIFKALQSKDPKGSWSYVVASVAGSALNTVFFLGTLALLFFNVQFTPEQSEMLGGLNTALNTVIAIATGINAPIEMLVCAVIGSAVGKGVAVGIKKLK